MAPSFPSVQSFFQPAIPLQKAVRREAAITTPGDAFTEEEVESTLDPLNSKFNPNREYLKCDIGTLIPGPQTVTFMGRVVNFSTVYGRSKSHVAAKGWHHMIVKDDTGAVCVSDPNSRRCRLSRVYSPFLTGIHLRRLNSTLSTRHTTSSSGSS
jgi:hypothetical protein